MVTLLEQSSDLPLSAEEKGRLHELERIVEKHLDGFLEVGRALTRDPGESALSAAFPKFRPVCSRAMGFESAPGG